MKRYTFFTDDYPAVTCEHCYEDQNENYTGPAIDRLAEYESTGLMPAEVAALQYQLKYARREAEEATKKAVDLMLQQRWIPVTERLPEEMKNVLAYTDVGSFSETAHWTGYRWEKTWDFEVLYGVTHWMPLPEPPKEDTL